MLVCFLSTPEEPAFHGLLFSAIFRSNDFSVLLFEY